LQKSNAYCTDVTNLPYFGLIVMLQWSFRF